MSIDFDDSKLDNVWIDDGDGGKFRLSDILFSPRRAAQLGLDWLRNRRPGPCVVCGEPTYSQFINHSVGEEFVHDYHEPEYIGCKEVWRYWQDLPYTEKDSRDTYTDYHSYIASREWEIKAYALKRAMGFRCQRCGRGGSKTTLHVHHKHYKTLYKERRKDLEVLCPDCHRGQHNL